MQTLTCVTPGVLEYSQSARPELQENHAIIRVKRIGICGTDLHAFEGTQPYFSYPRILGHELSGELIAADGAPGFEPNEKLTFLPYFNCGACIACRKQKPNCCERLKVYGVHTDGGMREYISVPSSSLVHGEGLDYDELALVEPLAIGAHGISKAEISRDDFVLVVGAGPIGMGAMDFARISGARVIAMDVNDQRLTFCMKQLKVHATVNARSQHVADQLKDITGGDMPSVIIDATGNIHAINKGIDYLAHGGRYILIGLQKERFSFSHPEFHKREALLMSSRNATRDDFDKVIRHLKNGSINPQSYITHRIDFSGTAAAFPDYLDQRNGVIKAMIDMG